MVNPPPPPHYNINANPIGLVSVIRVPLKGSSLPLFTFGFQTGTPSFAPGSGEAGMSHPVSWFTYCYEERQTIQIKCNVTQLCVRMHGTDHVTASLIYTCPASYEGSIQLVLALQQPKYILMKEQLM